MPPSGPHPHAGCQPERGGQTALRDVRHSAPQRPRAGGNALRADMTDLREHVDRGFLEVRGRLDATAAGQQQIVDLLGRLVARDG